MKRIFSFDIMKNLTDPYTITRCDYCGFIIFVRVFIPNILRPYKEWIFAIF